jgi:hypothetical protein
MSCPTPLAGRLAGSWVPGGASQAARSRRGRVGPMGAGSGRAVGLRSSMVGKNRPVRSPNHVKAGSFPLNGCFTFQPEKVLRRWWCPGEACAGGVVASWSRLKVDLAGLSCLAGARTACRSPVHPGHERRQARYPVIVRSPLILDCEAAWGATFNVTGRQAHSPSRARSRVDDLCNYARSPGGDLLKAE